jgi:hypothetical protein
MALLLAGLSTTQLHAASCALAPKTVKIVRGKKQVSIVLPAKGSFVEESHYLTTLDKLPKIYPRSMKVQPVGEHAVQCNEGIEEHLKRSLELYRRYKPKATYDSLYSEWWQKVWTPREGGQCGQGSIGDLQLELLTPETELWLLTMMWAPGEKPAHGSRFLLSYKGRHVVAIAGFETGPHVRRFLGGVTPEIQDWLRIVNATKNISIGYLADQTLEPGPIDCQ